MNPFTAANTVWASRIRDAFGPALELQDEKGKTLNYQVENEFDVSGRSYAVLRREQAQGADEPEIFKVVTAADGTLSLETIEDDDEWEDVSELYDELTFPE
ncbi:DUF1292 domain-containing protein [Paenibacillus caui]|uniref:DUF1292 domain-containing protein n=1 Tax=Paenibacillus caui TaxID=2873927 RepID=UPI001CA8FEB6|nr:DUF1292 domain-containing protein [Paenibacillus caui]